MVINSIKEFVRSCPTLFKFIKIIKNESHKLLLLDYPIRPVPRYGYGKPPHGRLHKIMSKNKHKYRKVLQQFLNFKKELLNLPLKSTTGSYDPSWLNGWLPGLDVISLYSFLCIYKPVRYYEVGSGESTKLARKAITDNNLLTRIVSIDPEPRAEIDSICDTVIRDPLEEVNLRFFEKLKRGDILFVDGSHRCLMNSDVTAFFLDILPRLKSGVIVQLHDIFLPYDYPPGSEEKYYSEQYLLAVYLLANEGKVDIILPNAFVSKNSNLLKILNPLWGNDKLAVVEKSGASFWIKT